MLFNSTTFLLFIALVFLLYWFVCNRSFRLQNIVLLIASYIFYGWWNWRYLFLIVGCSAINFVAGRVIYESKRNMVRRVSLILCCTISIGALCYFKYYNFFVESFASILSMIGLKWNPIVLNVMLPVGISFFTFQALSYTIDIMLGKLKPTRDWVEFFVYISFFPQLVAGPIERAANMLPQFQKKRIFEFDSAAQGCCLIAYGLFKKVVVADSLAIYVDRVFAFPGLYSSTVCMVAAFFFSIQIYCDFSGYSDCARGVARLLGFELMINFDRPYLASSFIDFWRRWHISLSTWFKDYLYIPLGGSRKGFVVLLRNIWVVFILSGLWHGAAWTFVMWGALHALYQSLNLFKRRLWGCWKSPPASFMHISSILLVNVGVIFAWIFFRAPSIEKLKEFMGKLFSFTHGNIFVPCGGTAFLFCLVAVWLLGISYLCPRNCVFLSRKAMFVFCSAAIAAIVFLGAPSTGEFIYFQF